MTPLSEQNLVDCVTDGEKLSDDDAHCCMVTLALAPTRALALALVLALTLTLALNLTRTLTLAL